MKISKKQWLSFCITLFILIVVFPIYPKQNISNILMYGTGGIFIISWILLPKKIEPQDKYYFIPFFIFMGIDLFSFLESDHYEYIIKVLVKDLRYGIIGIIFCSLSKLPIRSKLLLTIFRRYYVMAIMCLCGLFCILWYYWRSHHLINEYNYDIRGRLQNMFNYSGTYFCIFVGTASLFILDRLISRKNNISFTLLSILALCFLLFIQSHSYAEMPFYATIIVLIIRGILAIIPTKRGRTILFSLLIITSGGIFTRLFLDLRTLNNYNLESAHPSRTNYLIKTDPTRVILYNTAFNIWKESSIDEKLFGVGIGDLRDVLYKKYRDFDIQRYDPDSPFDYENHNQYLFYLNGTGILGLLTFLGFIFWLLFFVWKYAFSYFDLFFSLMSLFCLSFLTENVLYSQHGAILFGLIIILFSHLSIENKKQITCSSKK